VWNRLRRAVSGAWTSALAGGLFLLPLARLSRAGEAPLLGQLLVTFLVGALYGLVILGVIRLFRTSSWGHLVAGPLAGLLPVAVVAPAKVAKEDLGGLFLLSAILGLLIAVLEWARLSAEARRRSL
jgi:hypothetical protein